VKVEQQIEYEAKSDAEAIQVARDRLGREAVILSSRPVKLGGMLGFFKRDALWITAGVLVPDQEELLKESRERMVAFQHLLEVRRAVGGPEAQAQSAQQAYAEPAANTAFSSPAVAAAPVAVATRVVQAYESNVVQAPIATTVTATMTAPQSASTKDVDEIKTILSNVLDRLGGVGLPSLSMDDDIVDGSAESLISAGVDRAVALDISDEYRESGCALGFQDWLSGRIPTMGSEATVALGGKRVLFAGPTGVGKTTTIAKIAATQSLWGNKKVVLMTADTYRIAAVEQLRTYAKILGIPIEITADPKETQAAIKKHKDADLILLDTAGRSHYDGERLDELRMLYESFMPDTVHLVMAANIKYRDMLNVIERMGVVPISALLFTKLDETASYGTILNVLHDFNLPVSFFTIGQNVPNDIEIARGDRFVDLLLDNASILKKD
jgi:flagellar biosynthesis protein FlhF